MGFVQCKLYHNLQGSHIKEFLKPLHHLSHQGSTYVKSLWPQWKGQVKGPRPFCQSFSSVQFSSVQVLSHVWLFVTPWTAACQASLSITSSWSLLKLMSINSVMPSNHLILCCPLLLLPSILPSIRTLFQWVSSSHQVAKVLEFQLQHLSFQWIFRTDFL